MHTIRPLPRQIDLAPPLLWKEQPRHGRALAKFLMRTVHRLIWKERPRHGRALAMASALWTLLTVACSRAPGVRYHGAWF
jgi:hypothetical protein